MEARILRKWWLITNNTTRVIKQNIWRILFCRERDCRILRTSFASHWITMVPIVSHPVLQRVPTRHARVGGVFWNRSLPWTGKKNDAVCFEEKIRLLHFLVKSDGMNISQFFPTWEGTKSSFKSLTAAYMVDVAKVQQVKRKKRKLILFTWSENNTKNTRQQ